MYLIGLDCGGTSTRGVLAGPDFRPLARSRGGPGNPLSAGREIALRSYRQVIERLLARARLAPHDVTALGVGAAGAGREPEERQIVRMLQPLLTAARIRVSSDGLVALLGGTGGRPGMIVIAGTGSFVLGLDRRGVEARGGGWGPLLGDEGSGATMGREAIQAVLRAEDGRDPPTRLREVVFRHFRVRTAGELVSRIYRRPPAPREYARIWPALKDAADAGDAAARAILRQGGCELARTVIAVARRLDFGRESYPIVLVGGVLGSESLLRETLLSRLGRELPRARPTAPEAPPEVGALHLAVMGPRTSVREGGATRRGRRPMGPRGAG